MRESLVFGGARVVLTLHIYIYMYICTKYISVLLSLDRLLSVSLAVATLSTRDVYSRVLKHSGDKIRPRIHPAFTEPLEDARVSDLSSPEAVELVFGTSEGGDGGALSPPFRGVDWLHPAGTSDHAKGVSVVAVVDPMSRKGLGTLEQVCMLVWST